jgi:hypothetical protein
LLARVGSAALGRDAQALMGTLCVRDFVVPKGVTRVVTGNLDIVASHNIEIDGTLVLESAGR